MDAELGHYFSAADDLPNTEKVAVISDGLWRRAFAGDPAIVGRRIKVDGDDRTVVGVMPPGFTIGNERVEVWLPLRASTRQAGPPRQPLPLHGGAPEAGRLADAGAGGDGRPASSAGTASSRTLTRRTPRVTN